MSTDLPADLSLWDERCMRQFIEANSAVFRVFASRYVEDPDAIDDFLQEAYIRLWTYRRTAGRVKSLRNYFFTILHNVIVSHYDAFGSHRALPLEAAGDGDIPADSSLFRRIVEAESAQLIADALRRLSPQSREVLRLSLEGKSMPEIADALGLSLNTVRTVKYRALKRLSDLLSKDDFLLLLFLLGGASL